MSGVPIGFDTHGDRMMTAWRPHGDRMETAWRPDGDRMETAWRQHGDRMETAWRRHGDGLLQCGCTTASGWYARTVVGFRLGFPNGLRRLAQCGPRLRGGAIPRERGKRGACLSRFFTVGRFRGKGVKERACLQRACTFGQFRRRGGMGELVCSGHARPHRFCQTRGRGEVVCARCPAWAASVMLPLQ
eukprot:356307-Chlamydomonas_euryale.AAC.3